MLDLLTAAPKEIRFGDRTLRVGALKLRELGLLQRWIRDHGKRPTAEAKEALEFLPEEEHRTVLKEAYYRERDHWPPQIGTWQGNTVLLTDPDGALYFLGVMLRKYQPDLTDADLDEITAGLSDDDMGTLVAIAFGQDDLDPEAARAIAKARIKAFEDAIAQDDPQSTMADSSTTSGPASEDEPGPGKSES